MVSIEPAFPPDSNVVNDNGWKRLAKGFNRAGVSARFQRNSMEMVRINYFGFNRAGVSARFQQDLGIREIAKDE